MTPRIFALADFISAYGTLWRGVGCLGVGLVEHGYAVHCFSPYKVPKVVNAEDLRDLHDAGGQLYIHTKVDIININ